MRQSTKLRRIGVAVLACGILVAALFYWLQVRNAEPDVDEAAAGFLRAQEHQTRLMMGPMGLTLSQWADALTRPDVEALLIVGFAGFVTYMCFRHARMAEMDEN